MMLSAPTTEACIEIQLDIQESIRHPLTPLPSQDYSDTQNIQQSPVERKAYKWSQSRGREKKTTSSSGQNTWFLKTTLGSQTPPSTAQVWNLQITNVSHTLFSLTDEYRIHADSRQIPPQSFSRYPASIKTIQIQILARQTWLHTPKSQLRSSSKPSSLRKI